MGVLVEPKPGSYVTEWEAVQINIPGGLPSLKKLLRLSPWMVQVDLGEDDPKVVFTQITNGQIERWELNHGEWVVKSPHGRFWFMGQTEFASQFDVGEE